MKAVTTSYACTPSRQPLKYAIKSRHTTITHVEHYRKWKGERKDQRRKKREGIIERNIYRKLRKKMIHMPSLKIWEWGSKDLLWCTNSHRPCGPSSVYNKQIHWPNLVTPVHILNYHVIIIIFMTTTKIRHS